MSDPGVREEELHALVDGELSEARISEVMDWLQTHPEEAVRVAQWQVQRLQLRRLHREIETGDTPEALSRVVLQAAAGAGTGAKHGRAGRSAWWQALAAVVVLGCGLALGFGVGERVGGQGTGFAKGPASFAHDAALAHVAFVPEVKHPVEVAARDEAHLVQWLSKRLGAPLKVPSLQAQGFRLLGGRLLPGEKAPRAQFMFEDDSGRRVTLYLTAFGPAEAPAETAFRSMRQGAVESFYWVDGRFGYALSAEMPGSELQVLARAVYQQLEAAGTPKP